MTTIRLSELLSPAFREPHTKLKTGEVTQLVLKGGRGSAKSSFAAVEAVLLLLKYPHLHGVVLRKVGVTLRNSVFAQYKWAIGVLGLTAHFRCTASPMEITYLPTGQKLLFFGADDAGKLKSIKPAFGYIGILHFEEFDQFSGEEEIRSIEQSVLRGGDTFFELKVFNPPRSRNHWANVYCEQEKPGQLIHHSTYLNTPPEWLGPRFLMDAEYLREIKPEAYEHEYMGIANSSGGLIFDNIVSKSINREDMRGTDRLVGGVDWGWYPDPFAFNLIHFDAARRQLYILDEVTAYRKSNQATAKLVLAIAGASTMVVCDSAEPKSVEDYRAFGVMSRAAEKGPGSVAYSYKWLQSLEAIIIDPKACPDTYEEFRKAAYDVDKNGQVIGIPDKDNHHIDAVRYATERIWRRRGR